MKKEAVYRRLRWTSLMIVVAAVTIVVSFIYLRHCIVQHIDQNTLQEASRMELFVVQQMNRFDNHVTTYLHAHQEDLQDTVRVYELCHELLKQYDNLLDVCFEYRGYYFPNKYLFMPACYITPTGYAYEDYSLDTVYLFHDYIATDATYQQCVQERKSIWRDSPYVDEYDYSGHVLLDYSCPLFDENDDIYTVATITSEISLWQKQMAGFEMYPDGKLELWWNPDSVIVYSDRPNPNIHLDDLPHYSDDVTRFLHGVAKNHQADVYIDYNGKNTIYYAAYIHQMHCVAVYSFPEERVYGSMSHAMMVVIGVFILGGLLIFLLYHRLVQDMSKQMMEEQSTQKDMQTAASIQRSLLSPEEHTFAGVSVQARLLPAKSVGGDLYCYTEHEGQLYFCVGDVSGKGIPAALLMAKTTSLFRRLVKSCTSPMQIMKQLNEELVEGNEEMMFVTMFIGALDLKTYVLTYCNAAHNPPLLLLENSNFQWLPIAKSVPIGLKERCDYVDQTTILSTGTTLFLYTDGITEAKNPQRKNYGEQRMVEALTRPSEDKIAELLADVRIYANGEEQSDDITILKLKV